MTTGSDGSLNSATDGQKPVRRLQTGVRSLLALVACCGAIFWAWRNVSDNSDPVRAEARSIQKKAIGALQSGKPAERLNAIVELVRLHQGDSLIATSALVGVLDDPDKAVRLAAVEALDSIGPGALKSASGAESGRAAMTALIRYLNDPDKVFAVAVVKALGSIGSSMVDSGSDAETVRASAVVLIRCLRGPEPRIRSAAAIALGKIASPSPRSKATSPIDHKAVMDALSETLGDGDAGVRRAAINAMALRRGASGGPPRELALGLKDESAENRLAAVTGLGVFRQGLDPWVPVLLRLAEHDPDSSVRERCVTTLRVFFTPPAVTAAIVPELTGGLSSADTKVRSYAASLLGEFKGDARAAIPELLRILNEPLDPKAAAVRGPSYNLDPASEAAAALGRIAPGSAEEKDVIAALIEVARSGPVSRRGWAAAALGEFRAAAAGAVPVLIEVIKDADSEDTFEREASAAMALGKIAPETPSADQAVAALLRVLKSKPWLSRATAVEALGRFGPKAAAAVPGIRALKDDRDRMVRDAAAKALGATEK